MTLYHNTYNGATYFITSTCKMKRSYTRPCMQLRLKLVMKGCLLVKVLAKVVDDIQRLMWL